MTQKISRMVDIYLVNSSQSCIGKCDVFDGERHASLQQEDNLRVCDGAMGFLALTHQASRWLIFSHIIGAFGWLVLGIKL